jgi:hypothetical protein
VGEPLLHAVRVATDRTAVAAGAFVAQARRRAAGADRAPHMPRVRVRARAAAVGGRVERGSARGPFRVFELAG